MQNLKRTEKKHHPKWIEWLRIAMVNGLISMTKVPYYHPSLSFHIKLYLFEMIKCAYFMDKIHRKRA